MKFSFVIFLLSLFTFGQAKGQFGYHSKRRYSKAPWITSDPPVINHNHQISLVVDYWSFKNTFIKDSGPLFGFNYLYKKRLSPEILMKAHFEFLYGSTTGKGNLLPFLGEIHKQTNIIYNPYIFFLLLESKNERRFAPFVGLNYRLLSDSDDTSTDYKRQQSYFTLPVGVEVYFYRVTLRGFYHLGFSGRNRSYIRDIGARPNSIVYEQSKGSGYHLEGEVEFQDFSVSLFYRAWDIKNSNTKSATTRDGTPFLSSESENSTSSLGLKLNFAF